MSHDTVILSRPSTKLDYTLTGINSASAVERGLAEAEWYQTPVPRVQMRRLLARRDGPALRDTLIWFSLILGSAYATWLLWGTWWAVLPYIVWSFIFKQ
jgi:Na+-transporting NADH:ubiquinone oxidoreductase subunit F